MSPKDKLKDIQRRMKLTKPPEFTPGINYTYWNKLNEEYCNLLVEANKIKKEVEKHEAETLSSLTEEVKCLERQKENRSKVIKDLSKQWKGFLKKSEVDRICKGILDAEDEIAWLDQQIAKLQAKAIKIKDGRR